MNKFVKGNPDMCIGCRTCMVACVVAHSGNDIFQGNPYNFTFNPKLHMVKTRKISVPVQCKHCENPACIEACPEKCISKKGDAVVIDTKKCIGCKNCVEACNFGAIDMIEVWEEKAQKDGRPRIIANKCDLCYGIEGGPACVSHCPTDCLRLVEEEDVADCLKSKRVAQAKTVREMQIASKND